MAGNGDGRHHSQLHGISDRAEPGGGTQPLAGDVG
jgi:hypothetical protein